MLREFAKYAFFSLKRKRRDFERSVLMYVSIKIPALTLSGRKSRVCVNTLDRLSPHHQTLIAFLPLPLLLANALIQGRRQIALARIGQNNHDGFALKFRQHGKPRRRRCRRAG